MPYFGTGGSYMGRLEGDAVQKECTEGGLRWLDETIRYDPGEVPCRSSIARDLRSGPQPLRLYQKKKAAGMTGETPGLFLHAWHCKGGR